MNSILQSYFERLKNHSKNGLQYYLYERSENMPFSANICFESKEGRVFNSWGNGDSLDEALGKALMELIERITFSFFSPFFYKPCSKFSFFQKKTLQKISHNFNIPLLHLHPSNTNGIAIHLNKNKAIESARLELIERHTILYALLFKISPHGTLIKKIGDRNCKFYFWQSSSNTHTVVGSVKIEGGDYFSSSCHPSLEEAIKKSSLELNSFLFLNESKLATDDFQIIKDDIDSFNRYHRYSKDFSAINFLEKQSNRINLPELVRDKFYFTELPQPHLFEGLFKFNCVRVIHPDAQQLFFDNWSYDNLNPRLITPDLELPTFPHIIA
jgi:ribosomal protein S12 methylthiotransferase accessory factor YcaO